MIDLEAQKKLRLALAGALVVILVLVGALVWSLTSDSGEVKAGPCFSKYGSDQGWSC